MIGPFALGFIIGGAFVIGIVYLIMRWSRRTPPNFLPW